LHPFADELARMQSQLTPRESGKLAAVWVLGCSALVLALARPVWLEVDAPDSHYGRDMIVALDVSGSMRAEDFSINGTPTSRLALLKDAVEDFLKARRGDRVGIIIFGEDAFTLAPLTPDIDLLTRLVHDIDSGVAGERTALGNAMALAVERLRAGARHRVLVLFTDGSQTSGGIGPQQALDLAINEGVRIYTVGIGSSQQVAVPRAPGQSPALTQMPLDEALLRHIAQQSGGRYFLGSRVDDMTQITREIDQLEQASSANTLATPHREWFWVPLLVGAALLLFYRIQRPAVVAP
jgi:Ca-activated chloride channel family protein